MDTSSYGSLRIWIHRITYCILGGIIIYLLFTTEIEDATPAPGSHVTWSVRPKRTLIQEISAILTVLIMLFIIAFAACIFFIVGLSICSNVCSAACHDVIDRSKSTKSMDFTESDKRYVLRKETTQIDEPVTV